MRFETVSLLLCTVDELVFVGSLVACLHSFIVPQLLRMIKELLSRRDTTFENDARKKNFKRERLAATRGWKSRGPPLHSNIYSYY